MSSVLLERMERTMQDAIKLDEHVMRLHEIARAIEQEIGKGELTNDLRQLADRLSELLK
jgi:hypothetical protein